MLEYSAPLTNSIERMGKASPIVTEGPTHFRGGSAAPIPAPAFTGTVTNNRMRTLILPSVSLFIPGVDAWEIPVNPTTFDIQRCNLDRFRQGASNFSGSTAGKQ